MRKIKAIYNILKRFINPVSDSPSYLIFFVTNKCVAKCQHCFYWKESDKEKNILKMAEIDCISKTTRSLNFLLLTGGEPFLRDELPEIAGMFYRNTSVRNLAIPTNGILGNKVVQTTEKILKLCPEAKLTVNVSLDGIGELHDIIRGTPDAFEKAIDTFNGLINLKKKYKNMQVGIITTISSLNQDHIPEIHNFVRNKLNVPVWAPFLIRGNPRNPIIKNVDFNKYKIADELLQKDIIEGKYKEYTGFIFSRINSAKNVVRREMITEFLKNGRCYIPCYAGKINAVIYPDGEVYPCELLDEKIDNIRNYKLDMKKLWTSEQANKIRKKIEKKQCFCTHECFLTTNILYNLKLYPKILYWWYKYL